MIQAHFQNIRSKILSELRKAEQSIKVAVYWFTNHELFDTLYHKQLHGVRSEIIIHNDFINNRETGLPFQKFLDAGGKVYFSSEEAPMHNKFCIIDDEILINGSYNWTYYSEQKNSENIIICDDSKLIAAFSKEFYNLTERAVSARQIEMLTKFEINTNELLSNADYLAHDLLFQAKALNKPEMAAFAFELAPRNLNVQKLANDLNLIEKCTLKSSVWVGLFLDKVKLIAPKDAPIPATFSTIVRTRFPNQTKSVTDIVFGEFTKASKNQKLTTMELDGLPEKPAGEAKVKFTFSIDINGELIIEKMSLDTGKKVLFQKNADWLIK